ncbi:MAG TPA: hypothetical protein VEA16_02925 [Vicinamibacterales bacterium]|nr:hypothetical protein [Vicinamibacterales bacterium]
MTAAQSRVAVAECRAQRLAKRAQLGHLNFNVRKTFAQYTPNALALLAASRRGCQKIADLAEMQSKTLRLSDESEPIDGVPRVVPESALGARHWLQQPDPLVVPHGVHG